MTSNDDDVSEIVVKALKGRPITEEEKQAFDDWKFIHSTNDILTLLEVVGCNLRLDKGASS